MAMRANDELLVGCSKRSYLTRVSADREAGLHAQWAPSCDKCADGLPFVSYRCTENRAHIWHVGHDSLEGTMMAAADTSAPLRGGDTWVAVSARGKGQPVKILTVNPVNVYFRAYGRGADESQKFKLSHDAFRTRYAPLQLADDRQKRLAREERTPDLAARIEAEPVAVVPESEPQQSPVPLEQPFKTNTPPKLTGEQAREVYLLVRDGASKAEVARTYGVLEQTVYEITTGKTYKWATEGLLGDAPTPTRPSSRGRPKLTDEHARNIFLARKAGESLSSVAARFGTTKQTVLDIELGKSYRSALAGIGGAPTERRATVDREPTPQPQPQEEEPPVQTVSPTTTPKTDWMERALEIRAEQKQAANRDLATEMADALDVLVEYAGKPLPKFIRLDFDAIRALIEQARAS